MSAAVPTCRTDTPTDLATAARVEGRHRRAMTAPSRVRRVVDVVSRLGSLVTLSALMVLATTAGGLADGTPPGGAAAVTATFDGGANP